MLCSACGQPAGSATLDAGATGTPTGPRDPSASHGVAFSFSPGQSFGSRYTVVEEVGAGGAGVVYKAIDRKLGRTVALKLIQPRAAARAEIQERFRRELALAQQVTHANVCRVHDLGEFDGILYISMEFIEGQTLDDLIQSVGHLSPRQTVALGRQICAGLKAIHERSIVHRDLKPGNVMVDRSGHALLMDFGMAYHPEAEKLTREGAVLGTLAYLSPEQARGAPTDLRSDLYALGLILFEMLTGRRAPGDGGPAPLALRESAERCPPPSRLSPEVPAALDAIVLRCLERDPARRFATAGDLDTALAAIQLSSSASGQLNLTRAPSRPRALTIGACLAAGLLLLAWLAVRWRAAPPATGTAKMAILPLSYDGPESTAYVRDAIPVLLERALRASPSVDVAPFASSRGFDSKQAPAIVAQQMGVSFVLHGSVHVEGDKASLDLALSGPKGLGWSEKQETTLRGAFADAERTAAQIVRAMGATPAPASGAPQRPEALELYLKGKTLLEGWDVDRNYAGAEASLEEATRLDPNFAEAYALLAQARWTDYKETQRAALVQQAIDAADKAVALAPAQPEGHLARGVVLLGRGQSVEASQSFERAQRLAPGDDAICRQIADAYASLRRTEDAERMYQRAIDLRPGYWESYNRKGIFHLSRAEWSKAKEMFRKVIELRPESDIGYSNLAAAHLSAGEIKEAEPVLQASLRIQPTAAAHNNLGFVYYALGRYEEAVREYDEAIKIAPNFRRWASLGDSHRQLGHKKEAGDAYARAIELEQDMLHVNASDAKTRAVLAMNLAAIGRCDDARREAARALGEAEDDAYVHYYSANAYALCGSRQEAVRQAALAIKGGVVDDIHTNPDLRPLLSEPRLRDLLAR